jgi:signal transduction histidine kinase
MSGPEMIHAFQSQPSLRGTPVIVLTAHEDHALRVQLLRHGATEFLVKPCSAEELRVRIANLLELKMARDMLQHDLNLRSNDIQLLIREVVSRRAALESALTTSQFARDLAETASQTKTAFLALVSHELGTPLAVLRLAADAQRRKAEQLGTSPHASFRRTDEAIARLEHIVANVLERVKATAEQQELLLEPIALEDLINDVVLQFESRLRGEALAIEVTVAQDARTVISDARLLRLILSNLLSNAITFTERGNVEISALRSGGVVLSVRDSGPGIDARDQERIFEPFGQVDDITHKGKPGLGMGLALVRELVASLGGSLAVASQTGAGSTFSVTLPERTLALPGPGTVGEGAPRGDALLPH